MSSRLNFSLLAALISLLFAAKQVAAQELVVKPVPTLASMPASLIDVVFQDSRGYMWYASDNGVYRDDGYQLRLFKIDNQKKIYSIAEGPDGRLWIATYKGIYILNVYPYELTYFEDSHVKDLEVRELFCDKSGNMWVATYGHLHRFDKDGKWMNSYLTLSRGNEQTFMSGMTQGSDGTIYMTSYSHGVYRYDAKFDTFVYMGDAPGDLSMTTIIQDYRSARFWIMTGQSQIVCFDPAGFNEEGSYVCSPVISTTPEKDIYRSIHYMAQDKDYGYLWVSTRNSLLTFKPMPDGHVIPVDNILTDRLRGRMMKRIVPLRDGLLFSSIDLQSFSVFFSENPVENDNLSTLANLLHYTPCVLACHYNEADPDILWLIIERTGLVMYNSKTKAISFGSYAPLQGGVRLQKAIKLSDSPLYKGVWEVSELAHSAVCLVRNGNMIEAAKSVSLIDVTESTEYITSMVETDSQMLWLGTTQGLFRYNLATEKLENHYQNIGHVVELKAGQDNDVWAATVDNGLLHFLPDGRTEHYCEGQYFSTMEMDGEGFLWLTDGASEIFRFDTKEKVLADFTEDCMTRDCFISQILIDDANCPWIVTDKAVIQFNPQTRSSHWHEPKDYNSPVTRFEAGCLYQDKDNVRSLCFAGVGGYTILKPLRQNDIEAQHVKPLISDVLYSNRSAIYDEAKTRKDGTVTLPTNAYHIEISFSSLCHRYLERVRYAYKMEGVDQDWIYTKPGENRAYYNELPKGSHKFMVRATDENGLWSNDVTTLLIYRTPWWYETWWAYTIYALLIVTAVILMVRYYIGRAMKESDQMWAESKQMIEMREYLNNREPKDDEKFLELDRMLLDKITATIEEHIGEEGFDINILANEMNMSRSTLFRKIKSITGKTPVELVRSLKMQRACRLLHDKDRNINEVAYMVGYFDRRQFTAVFKREIGVTPSLYQKQVAEEKGE